MAYAFAQLQTIENQSTAYNPTYMLLTMFKMYNIDNFPDVIFHITYKLIDHYQWKYPCHMGKLNAQNIIEDILWRPEYYTTCNLQG